MEYDGAADLITAGNGSVLCAAFKLEGWASDWQLVVMAGGGTSGSPEIISPDYEEGLECLLRRLGGLGASLTDVLVDSQTVQALPIEARRLNMGFPVELGPATASTLCRDISQRQKLIGRTDPTGGNPTWRIKLVLQLPEPVTGGHLLAVLRGNLAGVAETVILLPGWAAAFLGTRRAHIDGKESRHQVVTLLWLAGRALDGLPRLILWSEAREDLGDALVAAGGGRTPQYPLVALSRSEVLDQLGIEPPLPTSHGRVEALLDQVDPMFGLPVEVERDVLDGGLVESALWSAVSSVVADERELRTLAAAARLALPAETASLPAGDSLPTRKKSSTARFGRCPKVADAITQMYGHRCQRCGISLVAPLGPVAEAAHLSALKDGGPDTVANVLCLCPTDHRTLDRNGWYLTDELEAVDALSGSRRPLHDLQHEIDLECVRRQRDLVLDSIRHREG